MVGAVVVSGLVELMAVDCVNHDLLQAPAANLSPT